jgi:hypothetical protein
MEQPKEFIIIVSNRVFVLTRDQIHRDGPNYFTMFFEGGFRESKEGVRELKLYRDPYLFTFIHMYLTGYDILPLPRTDIPWHLSEETRHTNLIHDARFYGLDSLAQKLEAEINPESGWRVGDRWSGKVKEVWRL